MPADRTKPSEENSTHFIPRKKEMDEFARILPLNGADSQSNRVFSVWGEDGVGKSTFISEFRESERLEKYKILWIQPTRKGKLDTIPEFIRACSETVRYPSSPQKEKKISESLASAERGKVNPIVSDDSLLITRSSVAKQKKPYINQAAASSVGRTEMSRDDVEINVGLGESKANNHAEGFLDAIPLQSLGTDLTIIHIESFHNLSVSIVDWLRDYVFPAASRGAYRRSLVLLIESTDPLHQAFPNETWGEWIKKKEDYRLYPFSEADCVDLARKSGIEPSSIPYVYCKSLGYPATLHKIIKLRDKLNCEPAKRFLDTLPNVDQSKVAALSLPEILHADELDILFGPRNGEQVFNWFKELPDNQSQESSNGKSIALSDALRCEAISRFANDEEFKSLATKWRAMGLFSRNVPSRSDRAKLLLLSGLNWIDSAQCEKLFGNQSAKILPFITDNPKLFIRYQEWYRVSERIKLAASEAASALNHPGKTAVLKKANTIWSEQKEVLEEQIAQAEAELVELKRETDTLVRNQKEVKTQIRINDKDTDDAKKLEDSKSKLPEWLRFWKKDQASGSLSANLKNLKAELSKKIRDLESRSDVLTAQLFEAKRKLSHPFVDKDCA